jgi:hypothetical protein
MRPSSGSGAGSSTSDRSSPLSVGDGMSLRKRCVDFGRRTCVLDGVRCSLDLLACCRCGTTGLADTQSVSA